MKENESADENDNISWPNVPDSSTLYHPPTTAGDNPSLPVMVPSCLHMLETKSKTLEAAAGSPCSVVSQQQQGNNHIDCLRTSEMQNASNSINESLSTSGELQCSHFQNAKGDSLVTTSMKDKLESAIQHYSTITQAMASKIASATIYGNGKRLSKSSSIWKAELEELKKMRRTLKELQQDRKTVSRVVLVHDKAVQTPYESNKVWVRDCAVDTADLPEKGMSTPPSSPAEGVNTTITTSTSTTHAQSRASVETSGYSDKSSQSFPLQVDVTTTTELEGFQAVVDEKINGFLQGPLFKWLTPNTALTTASYFPSMFRSNSYSLSSTPSTCEWPMKEGGVKTTSVDKSMDSFWGECKSESLQPANESRHESSLDQNLQRLCKELERKHRLNTSEKTEDTDFLSTRSEAIAALNDDSQRSLKFKQGSLFGHSKADMAAILTTYKHVKSITLTPTDPIILSYLNPHDRRLRSAALKSDVFLCIEGPITVCNPLLKYQALRNHAIYQLNIASNIANKVDKCIHYLRGTFGGSVLK